VTEAANRIVQKLWSYCNVLRDDGLSYQDYLEQLTFLLFLKMADERAALTSSKQSIPKGYRWAYLASPQMAAGDDQRRLLRSMIIARARRRRRRARSR
jgi:type I restriction enzyme M protein